MSKIKTLEELSDLDGKVVLAHGCFDILHLGHVKYLTAAKKMGDILVVTVTADRFVNKGEGRPIFAADLRAEMLAALEAVDYVAVNESSSAVPAILAVKPDIYVKGQDYIGKIDTRLLEEKKAVESIGGEMKFTGNLLTFSSTEIINDITCR